MQAGMLGCPSFPTWLPGLKEVLQRLRLQNHKCKGQPAQPHTGTCVSPAHSTDGEAARSACPRPLLVLLSERPLSLTLCQANRPVEKDLQRSGPT